MDVIKLIYIGMRIVMIGVSVVVHWYQRRIRRDHIDEMELGETAQSYVNYQMVGK